MLVVHALLFWEPGNEELLKSWAIPIIYLNAGPGIFILITGYFSVFSKSKFWRTLVLLLFLWIVCMIIGIVIYCCFKFHYDFGNYNWLNVIFLNTKDFQMFWYMNALLVITLLMPVVNFIVTKYNKWGTLCFFAGILILAYLFGYTGTDIFELTTKNKIYNLPETRQLIYLICLYGIGGWIRVHFQEKWKNRMFIFGVCYLALLISVRCILFKFTSSDQLSSSKDWMVSLFYLSPSPLTGLIAISLFFIVYRINFKECKVWRFLGKTTLLTYVLHLFIFNLICYYMGSGSLGHYFQNLSMGNQHLYALLFTIPIVTCISCLLILPVTKVQYFLFKKTDLLITTLKNKFF